VILALLPMRSVATFAPVVTTVGRVSTGEVIALEVRCFKTANFTAVFNMGEIGER
jgi:hypothetical protein